MVLNATVNNISVISWQSVLLVEETGGPGENHRPLTPSTHLVVLEDINKYERMQSDYVLTIITSVSFNLDCYKAPLNTIQYFKAIL